MARLPDIPVQSWLDDQVKRFQETTSGYFDALEFDLGARDAESQIPADYPLPGGPDQWDEAERQNLEAAEKRRQEEEERRRLEQVAQEQARLAQAEEQRRAQAEAGAMEMARKLGIQTPDQAFSSFLGMAQRPRDNLSSVLFDRDSPLPGSNTESNTEVIANAPEQPSNPVSDFMSWASGYGGPTPDPAPPDRDPPRDNTSSMAFNEPAPARERGYFEPTETEQARVSEAWEGTKNAEPVGPGFLPGAVRQGLGYGLGALETAEAVTDPIRARLDPRVWTFARNGVMAEKLPDEFARMNDLMGAARPDGSQKLELTPEEQAELRRLEQLRETLYQGIKDDPDALTKYAQADPAYHLTTAVTDTAMIPAAGGVAKGLASGGARALGAGVRTAERAGYVADVAAQSVLDPTNLLTQPAVDVAARGLGAAARGGRNLLRGADAAAEAAEQAPSLGRRLPETGSSASPAMEAVEAIRTANLVTPERMVSLIGDRPEYLADVAQHILDQRRKVRDGTLTVRDTAKAYYMTLASQGADAIKVATVESKVPGFTVPENFWSAERAVDGSPIVRPEEAAAAWLFTPTGRQALDDLEHGVLNREAWREGQAVRAAFGDDRFRTNNVFSERAPVNGRTQFNMDSIQAWTDRFNDLARSGATPEQLMAFSKRLNGISEAKGPFLNHALGFGESPTIDAVEISAWLTGQGDVSRLSGKAADLKRQIDLQLKDKRVGAALGDRIGQQFAAMRQLLPPEATADLPDEVFNHVLHHWIWDRMKGTATTHQGFYDALHNAARPMPRGWGEIEAGPGAAESSVLGSGIAGARARPWSVIGAATGAVSGGAAGDEDTTWQERLRNAGLGAAVGGTAGGIAAKQGTLGAARLIDSLIKRGRWSPDILQTHPEALTRIKTLLGLAAEGLPDDALVELPGQASFLALSHMPELGSISKFLNGQGTAGEVRAMVRQGLGQRFETAVSELVADVVTGGDTRATRAGERRADLVTARGLPEHLRGVRDPRPEYTWPTYPSVFGRAQEIDQNPDPDIQKLGDWVGAIADELGIEPPRTFVAEHNQLNAGIHYPTGHKPVLVVTDAVLNADLTPEELRGLLMHEMGHLAEKQGQAARGQRPPRRAVSLADEVEPVPVPKAADDAARSLDSKLIETIDVIRGMRRVGAPEDIVESWERSLAQNSNLTLDAIQGLTKSAHPELLEAEIKAARQAAEAAGLDPAWTMPKQYPTPSRAPAGGVGPSPSPTVTPMSPIPDSTYTPPGPPVTSASAHTPQLPKSGSVQGSPDSVRQAHENFARLKAQREAKKTKPISDPDVGYILGALQKFKAGGPDRHARLSAISRYLQKKGPLPPELDAWKLARLYPGNKQAWQDAQEKLIKPALSAVKPEHQDLVSDTMKQLDALDIDNNLPDKVQGRLLNTAPEGKAPVGEVRREGEAVLESQRARANLSATEREYVRAQAERDALLQEMEQAGEGPTRSEGSYKQGRNGVPGGPAPESAMETERFTRRADQLEQANIRVETARARRDDASRIVSERIKQSQVKRTDAKLERAATRAQEVRSERKYTAGITPTDAEGVYTALREQIGEADADKVIAAIQATFKARDLGRDMLYQAGLIDQAQLDYLVKNFPHYSPIRYLDMINQAEGQVTKGKSFSVGSSPIKKLTEGGSDLESMDSVQATSEMLARTYDLAARNKVMRAVDGWADDPVLSQLVKRIDEAKDLPDVQDWQTKSVYKDGEKQLLAVRNEIADALDLSSPAIPGFIGKFFRFFSGHARTAFTTANPKFLAANAVLDAINFMHREMVNSPGVFGVGKESNPLRIGADLAEGYWASLGSRKLATRAGAGAWAGAQAQATASSRDQEDDPYYWHKVGAAGLLGAGAGAAVRATKGQRALMERMSAAGATIGQRSRFTKPEDVVRQLRGENIVVRTLSDDPGIIGAFKRKGEQIADLGGLIWDRPLAEIGAISESAPRIAAFKRAERQGKSQADAAMAARRISVDFDAGGKWAKQINDVVPFFNARVQGLVETADDFKKHPFKSAMAMTGIVGSLVALEIYNRTVAPEAYKDVSEYTKHHGAVVMSDKPPEGKGKWELAFLPLRGTAGSLVPLVSEAMSAAYGDDPKTWQELAWKTGVATFDQFSPIPADPEGLSSLAMLPVVGPTVSTMANYDLFRGEPIVSRSQQTLPTTEQYTDRTSQTARHVGRALGWSPTKIDWWVKNALGGPGEQAMSTADAFIHKAGADLPTTERDIPKGARDVPFFGPIAGRFLRTVGSERQNKAYERAEAVVARLGPQMVAELEADPDYQAATPDKQKQLLRSAQSKLEETAREMAGVPEFAEPKDLGLPPRFQGVEVGSPLEQEILKALSTPEQYRTQRQHSLAFQYKTSSSQYLDVSRRQRKESERLRQNVGDLVTGQSVR